MGQRIAKEGDLVRGLDTHWELVPSPGGPVPTPAPFEFCGLLDGRLSSTVFVDGQRVALDGSTATNVPPHVPQRGPFARPPSNQATVIASETKVYADGRLVAKNDDRALTCNDPTDVPAGRVIATGTVFVD